jgi:asparagine synthase (glutamine-hydrolysing)
MCGILGQIQLDGTNDFNIELFEDALGKMYHRGPDASGITQGDRFLFGHRRLSIIDLDSHASQPMASSCNNYTIVFNGEIYNFNEIKQGLLEKGHLFRTQSDTEVLLLAYIEYGIDCIQKFIGMFSFALHDATEDVTFVVRDRLGIKPLYYSIESGVITFSSEIKSILHLDAHKRSLDQSAISSYLSFRYPILNNTFFNGIHSLAPGYFLKIKSGQATTHKYWDPSHFFKEQKQDHGEAYYIAKLQELLKSSVNYRMISDVPLGAFLSGGVDSSAIVALMTENQDQPVKTFTIGFDEEGYNEFSFAKTVADQYKTNHFEITLSGRNYLETMESLIAMKDAPLSVPNEVPLFLMSQELKKHITVVLSGEGADEIFGGYGRIFRSPHDHRRLKALSNCPPQKCERILLRNNFTAKYGVDDFEQEIDHFLSIYSYTSYADKQDLLSNELNLESHEARFRAKFLTFFDELEGDSYENKMMYAFERIHLVGLLHRVDTTTMAASVEARVPFVDHRLVEFAFTVPLKYKLKWRNHDSQQLCPDLMSDEISEVYDTPKYLLKKSLEQKLPKEILYRKKMGFPVPLNSWFGGEFKQYAKDLLLSEQAQARGIYDGDSISRWIQSPEMGSDHSHAMKIWMLINLELFIRQYFDD